MSNSSRIFEKYAGSRIPQSQTVVTVNQSGVHPDLRGTPARLARQELKTTLQNAPETPGSSSGYTTAQLKDIAPGSIQTGYTGGPRNVHKIEDQME
jgi:hypothetical protein